MAMTWVCFLSVLIKTKTLVMKLPKNLLETKFWIQNECFGQTISGKLSRLITSVAGLKNALFAQSLFDQRKTNLPESVFGISHRQNVVDKRLLSSQNNTKLQ